jgi:hypothetical protein
MGINAHRAFNGATTENTYLRALTIDDLERKKLRDARDDIRDAISGGFRKWSNVIDREELFESVALATTYLHDDEPTLRPKFRMQGSWSYHTLNCATFVPPQQVDLDDGLFLPISFLNRQGTAHPAIISSRYFDAVEAMIAPLCMQRGWTLVKKPSCIRVVIDTESHLDIALYAIPDDEFRVLLEKASATAATRFGASVLDEAVSFAEEIYPNIPADRIMLAHRREGWKPSDPRKLEDWFQEAVEEHGEQLRRVCRYLKGWRDYTWEECRLSSIALMACVVTAFDEASAAASENRDDRALLGTAERLPGLLSNRIPNPVVDGQFLDEGWTLTQREAFVKGAEGLLGSLARALNSSDPEYAMDALRSSFGHHMPEDEDLFRSESEIGAPAILTSGILKDIGDAPDARKAVKIGGDGRYG